jgi:pyruvate/2-oxoglutarate dehydrogenase complex dihydrolipoamide dehydrogenase (E3) component
MFKKVGMIGCGMVGTGISQVILEAGYPVVVMEMDSSLLEKGLKKVKEGLERSVGKGTLSNSAKEEAFTRLSGRITLKDLKDCDLIIEAVFEDIQIKKGDLADFQTTGGAVVVGEKGADVIKVGDPIRGDSLRRLIDLHNAAMRLPEGWGKKLRSHRHQP